MGIGYFLRYLDMEIFLHQFVFIIIPKTESTYPTVSIVSGKISSYRCRCGLPVIRPLQESLRWLRHAGI
ncbi:hypothetical protein ARMSODRAFT_77093 [Armillaria solidipes]|uniref:Uncharacterized protein n=1 Tax=Armillaria solidipes TaxID=1076256 RepID=A0A2H3BZK1_9AGAR|nr:hypothetical protein ARMSODRAFT_77093 [Armillaria solidipes]